MANMSFCRGHRSSILASARLLVIVGAIGCSGTMSSTPGSGSAGAAGNGGRGGGPSGAGGSGGSATAGAGAGSEGGAGNGGRAGGPSGAGGTGGNGATAGAGGGGGNGGVAGNGTGGSSTGPAGAGGLAGRGGAGLGGAGRGGSGGAGSGGAGRGGSGGSSPGGAGGRGGSGGGGTSGGGSAGNNSGPEPFVFGVPPSAASRFKKGINLGNRLEAPNEGDWGGVIQAEDFPFIARRGFDHVRIPIRFSGHALAAAPYTIDAAFFSRVDTVLNQAAAANLAVVVDMHAYDDLAAGVSAHRDRFVALWTQIAGRYQSRPDTVAFELLNEPNGQQLEQIGRAHV